MPSVEIRVLGPVGIEDYHAHLLRLDIRDRNLRFASEADDRGIDGHCLRLLGAQTILIGGYLDGTLRAGLEIVLDRTAQHAEAIFTAEPGFASPALARMLAMRLLDEARRYRLTELTLHGFDDIVQLQSAAQSNGVEIEPGAPARLHFSAQCQARSPSAAASALASGYA